ISMHIEHHSPRRRSGLRAAIKFVASVILFAMILLGGLWVMLKVNSGAFTTDFGPPASSLNPAEQAGLWAYLVLNSEVLKASAGNESTPIEFVVDAGENASGVSGRLAELGLVADPDLLRLYMRYRGLDDDIEAGNFTLNKTMTIPVLADALTEARPDEIQLRLWEGWRVEQVADGLAAQPGLSFSRSEFLSLIAPGGLRPATFAFLADLPSTASLEGFLFPDTYRFLPGATTTDILTRFLLEFDTQVTPQLRADATERGLTLYQVIILASIVEREAVHDDERPTIASVYLNRLDIGMKLEADPTTQYALAGPENWWPPLDLDPRAVNSIYNTYVSDGLPPGPIANPGLSSIRAVIYPAQTEYLFFRARCDGSHYHNFSVTYEQHLTYACP
ncbi:MAG: endolytic transglycosylase MltG, partial [Chloroflexi bacterium]|nr:endolytic transglycosylase MltG [Chloroflexota bacterium]